MMVLVVTFIKKQVHKAQVSVYGKYLLEEIPVLSTIDGRQLGSNELHAMLVQDTTLCQCLGDVQASLPAHGGQNCVRLLLLKNLHSFIDSCHYFAVQEAVCEGRH